MRSAYWLERIGWIAIKHENPTHYSHYLHMSQIDPKFRGASSSNPIPVKQGEQIGLSGNSGYSCGAHLHHYLRGPGMWGPGLPLLYEEHVEELGYRFPPSVHSTLGTIESGNTGRPTNPCEGAELAEPRNAACCPELPRSDNIAGYCVDASLNPGVCIPEAECVDAQDLLVTITNDTSPAGFRHLLETDEADIPENVTSSTFEIDTPKDTRFVVSGTCNGGDPELAAQNYKCCYATAKCCSSNIFEAVEASATATEFCTDEDGRIGKCMDRNTQNCRRGSGDDDLSVGTWVQDQCSGGNSIQCCIPPQEACRAQNSAVVVAAAIAGVLAVGGTGSAVYMSKRRRSAASKASDKATEFEAGNTVSSKLGTTMTTLSSATRAGSVGSRGSKGRKSSGSGQGAALMAAHDAGSSHGSRSFKSKKKRHHGSTASKGSKGPSAGKRRASHTSKSSKKSKGSKGSKGSPAEATE